MDNLIIIGAGGFGREVLAWARTSFPRSRIGGFLDDSANAGQDGRLRAPLIGSISAYEPQRDDLFLCAVGNPALRRSLSMKIRERGGRFGTLVHPTAIVAEGAQLGDGVVICPFAVISVDARVGDGAAIYYHASVDHDAVVGSWTQISAHCDITGGARLGEAVFMGSHATILPRVNVGDGAIVGAGAVVSRDVPAGTTVIGVPARLRAS